MKILLGTIRERAVCESECGKKHGKVRRKSKMVF
jgi:hypothetical protein